VVRYFTVYGPAGRPDMSPYIFADKLLRGEELPIFGDGNQSRDFTFVDDIAEGTILASKKIGYEIINLGNNHPVSLSDFIKIIEKLTGEKAKIIEKPRHPADVPQTYADITKAKKLLNWQPQTDLKSGLAKFIDWSKFTQPNLQGQTLKIKNAFKKYN
jgi:nucleoside-diphosphate-sugar epimerase